MPGQVIRRGKEVWLVRVYAGTDGSGKRRWVNRTVHGPRRDAEKVRRALLTAKDEHRLVMPESITVGAFLERWIRDYGPAVRATTLDGYGLIVRKHLTPALGHVRLDRLTPMHIQQYLTSKQTPHPSATAGADAQASQETAGASDPPRQRTKPLSPSTARKHAAVLHKALRQAVRWGVLAANPCDRVDVPRPARFEARVWDEERVRLFLAEARRFSPHYRLYLAAILTGMRQGELLGLRWCDVDLALGMVSVRQTFYRLSGDKREGRKGQMLFKEPKTRQSRRTISLPTVLVEELRHLRAEQQEHRHLLGADYHDYDLVFCQPNGNPLHAHNVAQRDFRRVYRLERLRAKLLKEGIAKEALPKPLPTIRFHDLRHGHASWLLAQGENIKVVQERLGHSTPAFTLTAYSHVLPGVHEQAAARLEARLFGEKTTQSVEPPGSSPGD
jgi:integrase